MGLHDGFVLKQCFMVRPYPFGWSPTTEIELIVRAFVFVGELAPAAA